MRRGGLALGLVAVMGAALGAAYWLTRVADPPPMPAAVAVAATRTVHEPPPEATWTRSPTAAAVPPPVQREASAEVDIPPLLRDTEGPREAVREIIEEHRAEIRECHEAWLQQNPGLAGRMRVKFDITANDAGEGEVTHVELLEGGVGQIFVEGCVLNVFDGMRFPTPPDGQVSVVYPVQFDAVDDGGS